MAELYKGILLDGQARFTALQSTDIVEAARQTHGLSPLASAVLGRAMNACVMLASDFKGKRDRMSATIQGDGPVGSVVVVAKANGDVKGMVGNPHVDLPLNAFGKLDVGGAVGRGTLAVIADLGLKRPYTGTVELQSGEIGDDFAYYLLTSEQRPSICYVGVLVDVDCSIKSASGLIVEPMPECTEENLTKLEEGALQYAKLNAILALGSTLEQGCLQVLQGLEPRFLEQRQPKFVCDCSRERMEEALVSLPKQDLLEMEQEDGGAEIVCHFCHTAYWFDGEELRRMAGEENQ